MFSKEEFSKDWYLKNPKTKQKYNKELAKKYRINNRQRIREINKRYILRNKDKIYEKQKKYKLEHPNETKESRKKYYSNNIEKMREQSRLWRLKNKDRYKNNYRENRLKYVFKMTIDDYDNLLKSQNGVCAICKNKCLSRRRLAVDHCHKTGKIRGLLCLKCNRGLGCFDDNVDKLKLSIAYLKK